GLDAIRVAQAAAVLGIDSVEVGKRTDRLDHPGSRGTGERAAFNGDLPGDGLVTGSVTGLRHTRHHLQLAPHLLRRGVSHPPGAGVTAQNRKSPIRTFFFTSADFLFCAVTPSPRRFSPRLDPPEKRFQMW